MGEASIDRILKSFGLTDSEIEIYLFLAKHGILKCSEISKQMKKDRAQSLRILKSLQSKGLVESTLESPTRYVPVPFEQVIDLSIKAKRDEAAQIESTRSELLTYWKKIGKTSLTPSPDKLMVIEGDNKIYSKITQMVLGAKKQLSSVCTVEGLVRASHFGLFEAILDHPLKSNVEFRFLTEVSTNNLTTVKSLLREPLETRVNLKERNPDLGLRAFPRMVIKDDEEIMFFIKPRTGEEKRSELCLWTNCTDLVQSFSVVFEDLWSKATDERKKISDFENRKLKTKTDVIPDVATDNKQLDKAMCEAQQEVFMLTSSEGLNGLAQKATLLREWEKGRISVKIMAPITSGNFKTAQLLSNFCEVKHVPLGGLNSIVVDDQYLFQFKNSQASPEEIETMPPYEDIFSTNDLTQVKKTKDKLKAIWEKAQVLSPVALASIFSPAKPSIDSNQNDDMFIRHIKRVDGPVIARGEQQFGKLTEDDLIEKIIKAEKDLNHTSSASVTKQYGFAAEAVIHPPASINLPNMLIYPLHYEKHSAYGSLDAIFVHLWLETPKGHCYVPVAFAHDNPKISSFYKRVFGDINIQLLEKDEIQIQLHGKNLFCGWTTPILLKPNMQLGPSSILLEGYGDLRTGTVSVAMPNGCKITQEANGFESFVTFFHPSVKYSGPGTEGVIYRDAITTITLP